MVITDPRRLLLPANREVVGHCKPPKSKRFKKGVSGNPNGRPKAFKSIGQYIRDQTDEGKTLVDNAVAILLDPAASDKAIAAARAFLANYGFGKPVETQEINLTATLHDRIRELAPFLDASKKDEIARYLSAIEAQSSRS